MTFMTVHRGDRGHIKSHWDNHKKCSHCSRESTCSTCSSWSNSIWELAEKRRTYSSRKRVMFSRKKSLDVSVSSDERNRKHGNTAPYGPAARGKTHIGGNSLGTCTQGSTSPPVTGHPTTGRPATSHSPYGQEDISDRPGMPGHRQPVTGHSPTTGQVGHIETSSLPIMGTNHPATSYWT